MQFKAFMKKHKLKEGDLVEISHKGPKSKGYIIPSLNTSLLKLKLNTGYNQSIALKDINGVKKFPASKKVGKGKRVTVKNDPKLPTISIVNTGGTLVMRVDYKSGAVYPAFTPEDLVTLYPGLVKKANIRSNMVMNVASEDMRDVDWIKIANAVAAEIKKGADGVIVGHGTDTLHFTSAMLSFMLENVPVPVLVVGSQRSSDRGSSDAAMNLSCAFDFIKKTDFRGIGVCMHENLDDNTCLIMSGTKVRKMHSSRRDTFRVINDKPIARVQYPQGKIEYLKADYPRKSNSKIIVKAKLEKKVGLLKMYPGISSKVIDFYRKEKYKGLVIEGTGIGNAPVSRKENRDILKAIQKLVKSGCITVLCSQAMYGRVQMHVYRSGTLLTEAGVIPGDDMLAETALAKLAWLLGNYPKKEVPKLLRENLRGEITSCSKVDEFKPEFE